MSDGIVSRVNGPIVEAEGLDASMLDLVEIGPAGLPGEVIAIESGRATVQVFEYTGGLAPGSAVRATGHPLVVELGPGLVGGVFDGMLRRLAGAPDLLEPGLRSPALDPERRWDFVPAVRAGDAVEPGAILGRVPETAAIEYRALVPDGARGTVEWVAPAGPVRAHDLVARIAGVEVPLAHRWPVRTPRPVAERLRAEVPLHTGQRVLDLLYPIARGSSAGVPGGFGTGKTVLLQQIAKWCEADVIVYVGCGERGNEMADVLEELSGLDDPRTGGSLLDRTILVANTSNMPVLAREASIYTGATVAELYRDMGYETVLIADSTSRWAEALREVSSRTGELPAEEGYPARLASALAAFYERAARVRTLSGAEASVTIIGAVSPAGGDMAEPVSAHTRRFVRCLWALDADLAYARHYPAVSWRDSSSRDAELLGAWHASHGGRDWARRRDTALRLLADTDRVEAIAELVGEASLPEREQVVLRSGRLLRDAVLQQSSLSPNDAHCEPSKQAALLGLVLGLHDRQLQLVARGVPLERLLSVDLGPVLRVRDETPPDGADEVERVAHALGTRLGALE
jgi:V/A-type H+-transporting ATPase subunit A